MFLFYFWICSYFVNSSKFRERSTSLERCDCTLSISFARDELNFWAILVCIFKCIMGLKIHSEFSDNRLKNLSLNFGAIKRCFFLLYIEDPLLKGILQQQIYSQVVHGCKSYHIHSSATINIMRTFTTACSGEYVYISLSKFSVTSDE